MSWRETHEACCRVASQGAWSRLERLTAGLITLGAAIVGIGIIKAVLRGAKLYSHETSSQMSSVLIPAAMTVIIVAVVAGIVLSIGGWLQRPRS